MSSNINQTIDDENSEFSPIDTFLNRTFKFGVLISCQIPSILCNLFIFYYFIKLRELRAKQHNHVIICLLMCNFLITSVELPITLVYLRFGQLLPSSYSLCLFWIFLNYFLFPTSGWIMSIASIQRYLIIFHRHLTNNYLKHYLPIVLPCIFLFVWYIVLIFFYRCEQQFDYSQTWCLGACYIYDGIIGTIDWILSSLIPVLITTLFNILIMFRVIHQKYKMQRAHTWRKTRKLALQLLSISFLFLSIYLPLIIFGLIRLWFDPLFLFAFTMDYYAYAIYLVPLLMPFVSLISQPEILTKIQTLCCFSNQVRPMPVQQLSLTIFSRRYIQPTR